MKTRVLRLSTLCLATLWMAATPAVAQSARGLVDDGIRAYLAGRYDEALEAYEEATVTEPESPEIYFDKGAAHYRKEDYEKARDAFELAALKTKDLTLEARSQYNLGNCSFREGERQQDSDLQKSLEALEASVRHYQRALELDPQLADAAHNIEVTRLLMKAILDEIKKRQEAAEEQRQQQQEVEQKLKELIEQQTAIRKQTRQLAEEHAQEPKSPERQARREELAGGQQKTREETEALSEKMGEQGQDPSSPNPMAESREHVDRAAQHQAAAEKELQQDRPGQATGAQDGAVEELEEALNSLQNEGRQGEQQQQQGENSEEQQQGEEQQEQPQEEQEGSQEEKRAAALDENAKDILNEEQENRRMRQPAGMGYAPVDKDW